MNAKKVSAWQCGFCSKTSNDKERAEACCRCPNCKERPSVYTGHGTLCKPCFAAKNLKDAEEALRHAQENLERARDAASRLT
jgi:hypothetical protein